MIKDVSETFENKIKEQKGGFPGILAATLGATSLSSNSTGKKVIRAGTGTTRAGEGANRPNQDIFTLPHPLTNFFKFKNIIRTKSNLMMFILEITYLKQGTNI